MKILTVIGARPQFIKASVVSAAIAGKEEVLREVVVHTGQHFDPFMSHVMFEQLNINEPKYFLGIHSLPHGAMTGKMLEKIEEIALDERPDIVMVYGDTNSTLAGALAAAKLHIPVAHVEAGLRSYNMMMPEEVNRILTDRVSKWLFCPTQKAAHNLENEGFGNFDAQIIVNGDVMLDAAMKFVKMSKAPSEIIPEAFVLATIHRPATTDNPETLAAVFDAMAEIASQIPVVMPLHPRTKLMLRQYKISYKRNDLHIIDPVGYLESLWLLKNCKMVVTDSGGLQKEAYFFGKSCLTLRDETEWTELVDEGVNITAGTNRHKIINAFIKLVNLNFTPNLALYGEGKAAERIVNALVASNK